MKQGQDLQRRRGIEILDLSGYASHEPVWLLSDNTYVVGATRLNAVVKAWMIGTVAEIRVVQNVLAREAAVRMEVAAAAKRAAESASNAGEPRS